MKKTSLLFLVLFGMVLLFSSAAYDATVFAEDVDSVAETTSTTSSAITGNLGNVFLITGNEIEIEFNEEVLNNADAQDIFTIKVDGAPVEWEYLSYFDFGPYGDRGGVVNVRLNEALEVGRPREQRRTNARFPDTQKDLGPVAAARVTVVVNEVTKTANWKAFYEEVNQGYMSMLYTWGAAGAGNSTSNSFSDTNQQYNTDYVTKQMSEGTNSFVGRSEYLNIPANLAGMQFHVLGGTQSVYEAPAYRELYKYGETDDTYTRVGISGSMDKPIIVTTADEVMRHDSVIDTEGNKVAVSGELPARPRRDYFDFGEDFFRLYYEFGVLQGSKLFPIGQFDEWDEYRYDIWLERAYDEAVEKGLWPDTIMMDMTLSKEERLANYYIYGAMVHHELIDESDEFKYDRFPVNTRAELYEYDHALYRVMCGVHGRFLYFSGPSGQTGSFTDDTMKTRHPWFWRSQPDNYYADENSGVHEYEPLKIEHAHVISNNQLEVKFNRPVSTIRNAVTASNWRIYIDGREITPGSIGGYAWDTITLTTTGSNNRLDNGLPYGRSFSGFTQGDIDERKVDAGGWISNSQAPGANALERGEYVSLEDAITRGAGLNGKVEVAFTGSADVRDWAGNSLGKPRVQAEFNPWVGSVYRTALTGFYIYADSVVTLDTMMAAGHMYESVMLNNETVTYDMMGGELDQFHQPTYSTPNKTPITYSNTGQKIIDGSVRAGGGMQIVAGEQYGHHPAMQPSHRNQINSSFHQSLYVEGWGGNIFQSDEVLIKKDTMLSRYKNENLVLHEGGHGWDSYTGTGGYANYINRDIASAHASAIHANNGRRYFDQFNASAYLGARTEMYSTGTTYWGGAMREQYMGVHDGTWTPINSREEFFRYDPYDFEVFKRGFFNGDLGMWYYDENGEPRVGDPDYRVIPEDWELLAETYPEFADWKSNGRDEDNLIAWGSSIHEIARDNPYTGYHNPLVNWISWNTPNVWGLEYVKDPATPGYIFDFVQHPYNPADPSPTESQEHPFFRQGGVQRPQRSDELIALVTPVEGEISNVTLDGGVRANLVEFEFTGYDTPITMDNAPTSFEIYVDDQLTYFTFWSFEEIASGVATVRLRLEWPVEMDAEVEVSLRPVGIELTPAAIVKKVEGNKNELTITVREELSYGMVNVYTETFSINDNTEGTYEVGDYLVYVNTKGNTQIRDCYIVE
ncbi:hypothetical protein [Sedimentibacter sp.]|uniref:hypothetical protein n=3 Tax=Sedimentibacter sp. TaxID=1960295 RepID=UPI0028A9D55B|nr:hypothetical protein [Sedimentibacter sp.]